MEAVSFFLNSAYVDSSEAGNMRSVLTSAGLQVGEFADLAGSGWTSSRVIIPELENGKLHPAMSETVKASIRSHVSAGALYVVGHVGYAIQNHGGSASEVAWLNDVFQLSLSAAGSCGATGTSFTKASALLDSPFASAPAALAPLSNTLGFEASSLPAGAVAHYTIGSCATVAVIPFGKGKIVTLGYDWYSSSAADWNAVLLAAMQL